MRRAAAILATLLLAAASPALAQQPTVASPEVAAPTATAVPTPDGCNRGPGTDADYAYCGDQRCNPSSTDADYQYAGCCRGAGTDADYAYTYCVPAESGGGPTLEKKPAPVIRPLATAQQLPMTGDEPIGVAMVGLGLLLAGTGLRLRPSASPRR